MFASHWSLQRDSKIQCALALRSQVLLYEGCEYYNDGRAPHPISIRPLLQIPHEHFVPSSKVEVS